jgi:hypothetical protein
MVIKTQPLERCGMRAPLSEMYTGTLELYI